MAKRRTSNPVKKVKAAAKAAPNKAAARKPAKPTGPVPAKSTALDKKKKPVLKGKVPHSAAAKLAKPGMNGHSENIVAAIKLRKTPLSPAELEEFRGLLMEKRRELLGDVANLENEAMNKGSSGESNASSAMPIHMADLGTDTWEQELTLGLIENERGLLREIDEALDRIDNKTYGICIATNRPISKARLRAKPWAKYCIEYARQQERGIG